MVHVDSVHQQLETSEASWRDLDVDGTQFQIAVGTLSGLVSVRECPGSLLQNSLGRAGDASLPFGVTSVGLAGERQRAVDNIARARTLDTARRVGAVVKLEVVVI